MEQKAVTLMGLAWNLLPSRSTSDEAAQDSRLSEIARLW